ncbi:hypothetical protein [Brevibacillus dissolubilis]|uniref:hypothetical protein n=1 Tax=Brevibacillus dissolubilis TaxID=1844116 RepID=UPI001115DC76|nr:hypothetical protein [Brevibacillus dissolubilis]
MDEHQHYFKSVDPQSLTGDIIDNETDTSFDFEILATAEELRELQQLFHRSHESDLGMDSAKADEALHHLYRKIYQLGTPDTRQRAESLGIINISQ